MAKLDDNVKRFIVQALACFDTPSQVSKAVKEEFGLDVLPQNCQAYDPTKHQGKDLSLKWRAVFESTRKQFLEDIPSIPIANRAVRIRRLERLLDQAERSRNMVLAAQLMEQIAKEAGGMYTNRQRIEHTGADGGPVVTQTVTVDEKALAAAADRLQRQY